MRWSLLRTFVQSVAITVVALQLPIDPSMRDFAILIPIAAVLGHGFLYREGCRWIEVVEPGFALWRRRAVVTRADHARLMG